MEILQFSLLQKGSVFIWLWHWILPSLYLRSWQFSWFTITSLRSSLNLDYLLNQMTKGIYIEYNLVCPRAAISNYHKMSGFNNWNFFAHSSGGQSSEIEMLSELHSLWKFERRNLSCLFQLLVAAVLPNLHMAFSSVCLLFFCLS